jgi:RNA polymerase sigma factor (sigma-70 family)
MPETARTREPGTGEPIAPERSELAPPDSSASRFHALYTEHFDFVWRSLRLLGVPFESLDDAAQDVFGVMFRRLAEFEGNAAVRTWLFGIVRRIAANHRRRQQRKQWPLQPLVGAEESPLPAPDAQLELREAADSIARFCETLDEEQQSLFVLALLEGVPAPELVEPLGVPLNTVYSRIRTLRQALKRFLEQAEGKP